ncbi:MAG: hypothetical protein JXB49_01075, partial [Bacteroidales bacterium]|nr:hypothetical protein [Bacteroidales bacterium]
MKTIIKPFYERNIDPYNPFEKDYFQRKIFADNLTNLLKNSDDGLVLTINANWGDGKTTFIKLWEFSLKQTDLFIPIYYNAHVNDFSGDAFISIASLIHNALNNKLKEDGINVKHKAQLDFLKKASKELAIDLLKMGTGIALSSVTGGLIKNQNIADWFINTFKKLAFGTFEVNVDEQFKSYINSQKSIKIYQEKLETLLSYQGGKRKIVFFIDELDRCRPDFSVEVIEKVKHLFNIKNVFFVLAINKEQLLKTIGSVYGVPAKEAFIYLQKFVHIETKLPQMKGLTQGDEDERIKTFIRDVIKEYDINENIISSELICDTINYFYKAN